MKTDRLTLTRALDWANRHLQENPHLDRLKVAELAAVKFNLGPLDEEWLLRQLDGKAGCAHGGVTRRFGVPAMCE
jgi:hypothetical protein